jgi:hypothetical protein
MPLFLVTRAVARDLIEGLSNVGGQRIGHERYAIILELLRIKGRGYRFARGMVVIDKFPDGLCLLAILRRSPLRNKKQWCNANE